LVELGADSSFVQLGPREFRKVTAAIELPLPLLHQQNRTHQAGDRGVVGEDADDVGAALDPFVQALQVVGATFLESVLRGEYPECQDVFSGLLHQHRSGLEVLG